MGLTARSPRGRARREKGMTLLLVVLLVAAILSISLGIFELTVGGLQLSGEIADSPLAFYAADHGMERTLYRDRVQHAITCSGANCYVENVILPNQRGFAVSVSKISGRTGIKVIGQYQCPGPLGIAPCDAGALRVLRRALQVTY